MTEEQFLEMLEAAPADVTGMLAGIEAERKADNAERAAEWSQLLLDTLKERDDLDGALQTVEWQALKGGLYEDVAAVREAVAQVLARHHELGKLVDAAGFGGEVPAKECFARLKKLRLLKEGILCYNATWGAGEVDYVDFFYERVEIRFEKKRGIHELSLAYAAEALELLDDSHILAVRRRDPDAFRALIENDPAEIVRMILRSFGEKSVEELIELCCPSFFPEEEWKKFWERARRDLKADKLVEIPAKRTEPIRLLATAGGYSPEWFVTFANERDMQTVLERAEKLAADQPERDGDADAAVAGRLAFVIKGAGMRQPELTARTVLAARALGLEPEGQLCADLLESLYAPDVLVSALENLPARYVRPFLDLLVQEKEDAWVRLLELIPQSYFTVVNEVMQLFADHGRSDECRELYNSKVAAHKASPQMLLWVQRNPDKMAEWELCSPADFAFIVLAELEKPHSGHDLRAQNQLKDRFEQNDWLSAALGDMREAQREDFIRKLNRSTAWPIVDRNSVVAKVVKLYPDLHQLILRDNRKGDQEEETLYTSNRSYTQRREQLRHLVQVEIPENSREIELARSYGDLRENAEYKAAKEKQRLLMLQAQELEKMLNIVQPTDFSGFRSERAGPATTVELLYKDGRVEQYHILGYWDSDEKLGIISSQTRMAQALHGYAEGEEVTVPTESGETIIRLQSVKTVPVEIREWVKG